VCLETSGALRHLSAINLAVLTAPFPNHTGYLMSISIRALVVAMGASAFAVPAFAQNVTSAQNAEVVVVTGTRVAARSALDTASPVDVINANDLSKLGVTEVSQALAISVPSFNFPRPGLADGTNSIGTRLAPKLSGGRRSV
jgi:outer membrane receptor protein involved in Fe transport